MGDVTKLKIANAPVNTKEEIATYLREVADEVEKGDHGEINKAIVVLHSIDEGLSVSTQGPETFTTHSIVGMLELAKWVYLEVGK